jgi:hypothetical protein
MQHWLAQRRRFKNCFPSDWLTGFPITEVLVAEGLDVFAIDAAPSLVEAFRRNLPNTPVICEAVQDSTFFIELSRRS